MYQYMYFQASLDSKFSIMAQHRERLRRNLQNLVTSPALDKTKSDWANLATLGFKHRYREKRVRTPIYQFSLTCTCTCTYTTCTCSLHVM